MPNVVKKLSISSELAQKMVNAAVAKARELGVAEMHSALNQSCAEIAGNDQSPFTSPLVPDVHARSRSFHPSGLDSADEPAGHQQDGH
jgi:hypothetical protein